MHWFYWQRVKEFSKLHAEYNYLILKNIPSTDLKSTIKCCTLLNSSPVPSLGFLCVPSIVRCNDDNFVSYGERHFFWLIEFYLETWRYRLRWSWQNTGHVSHMNFLLGLTHQKVSCLCGSEIRAWSCLFFVSGRFSCLPAGIYLSYIFPSLSKTLYKVKILQKFLCCINLFEARHVIKMLGHILKNYPQFKCTGLLNQFSECLLEVQSFHTHRNPRHMFILTTKEVFLQSLLSETLDHLSLVAKFFFSVSVFNIHWILIRMLPSWFTFSLQAMSPSTFYPSHSPGFFLQNTLLKGLLQSGHVYELILVILFLKQKETVAWLRSVFWWKLIWKI